jgi:hypothetical protein
MTYVLIEHTVGDFETFRKVYLDDGPRRARLGSKGGRVYRGVDDPNDVFIVLDWDGPKGAKEFAGSLELHEAMQWSTSNVGMPRIEVLEHAFDSET